MVVATPLALMAEGVGSPGEESGWLGLLAFAAAAARGFAQRRRQMRMQCKGQRLREATAAMLALQ